MKYILKSFDKDLIKFDLRENIFNDFEIHILDVVKDGIFPLGLTFDGKGLLKWLENRNIPKNREYVNEILNSLGLKRNDLFGIINLGMSLSLNDSYWVVKEGFDGKWSDYNLYHNDFNKTIGLVAYTGHGFSNSIGTLPELTTGGTLQKAWRNVNGGIYLYKGGRKGFLNCGREPYCEFYASQIAECMGIKHISYDLEIWENELASTCELFTNEHISYVPMSAIVDKYSGIKQIIDVYKNIGENAYQEFCSMMVFDALIYNLDRHLGNFGVMRDSCTGEMIDISPVFDNGISLLDEARDEVFESLDSVMKYCETLVPAIGRSFNDNVAIFKNKLQQKQLLKLVNFKFTRHKFYNIDEHKLLLIEQMINQRAKELLEIKSIDINKTDVDKSKNGYEYHFCELSKELQEKVIDELMFVVDTELNANVSPYDIVDNFLYIISDGGDSISLVEVEPIKDLIKIKEEIDEVIEFDKNHDVNIEDIEDEYTI